jgi:putative membrane protein
MANDNDPYFIATDDQAKPTKDKQTVDSIDPYFTPVDDASPLIITDSIETEPLAETNTAYKFIQQTTSKSKTLKRLFFTSVGLLAILVLWQTYTIMIELLNVSTALGSVFGVFLLILLQMIVAELYRFRKGQQHIAKIEALRNQADMLINERSHGKSDVFISPLSSLYKGKPQQAFLDKTLQTLPDYLNDAELVARVSADFLTQLDEEAKRVISKESISSAGITAVSQVALIDSLIVIWKSLTMVNQINSIYGLSLSRVGQAKLYSRIVKAALLSAGSQIGLSSLAHKFAPGVSGTIMASLAQGLGVGTYVAKIGIEAMKQSRPIAFDDQQTPDINLIRNGIKQSLIKLSNVEDKAN